MGLIFKMLIPIIMILLIYGYMMGGNKVVDFFNNATTQSKGVETIGNAVTDEDVTVYQWVDENGVKHFSNTQPAGQNVDELQLSSKANVIKSINVTDQEASRPAGGQVTSLVKNPYSPGGAKEMIDQTQNLKNTLDQQMQDQQKILDQITGHGKKK